jgi:hypothetical protein
MARARSRNGSRTAAATDADASEAVALGSEMRAAVKEALLEPSYLALRVCSRAESLGRWVSARKGYAQRASGDVGDPDRPPPCGGQRR